MSDDDDFSEEIIEPVKHLREHYVFNVLGFLITTNHRTDGLYLPANDRRHYVAWSNRTKADFPDAYWNELWGWYHAGGFEHVAGYLSVLDLSGFDPKAPPSKTAAFFDIVNVNSAPEDAELADVLELLGNPDAVTVASLIEKANPETADWLLDRRNRRALPHRLERCGYTSVRNPSTADGRWKVQGKNLVIYAKASLSQHEQLAAARGLTA